MSIKKVVSMEKHKDKKDFEDLTILTPFAVISFKGKYMRELETDNWHYYKTPNNKLMHFRKEFMVCVLEDSECSITEVPMLV